MGRGQGRQFRDFLNTLLCATHLPLSCLCLKSCFVGVEELQDQYKKKFPRMNKSCEWNNSQAIYYHSTKIGSNGGEKRQQGIIQSHWIVLPTDKTTKTTNYNEKKILKTDSMPQKSIILQCNVQVLGALCRLLSAPSPSTLPFLCALLSSIHVTVYNTTAAG